MAINRIKPLTFKYLKPTEKEQLIPDGGNLYVRVRPIKQGGSISFRFFYRFEGKQKWLTLKDTDDLPAARAKRDSYTQMLKDGIDPNLEAKLIIERKKANQLAEQEAITKLAARVTVTDLFTRWHDTDLTKRKDLKEICRMFDKDVLPVLGGLFVEDVKKGHVTQVVDNLKRRDALHTARNTLKLMRQMFRFAVDRDVIEFDPTTSLSVVKTTTKPTERDRTLSELEIRALARQLPDANLLPATECAVWIALSTMCRIGELSKAEWTHINFEARTWKIPAPNSKNGRAHIVYLSDFALAQFRRLRQFASSDTWLFPNRDGSAHVCEKSITKQVGGRQTETILSGRSKDSQALVLEGGKWTPHDLRRTGATLMGTLRIQPDIIEKCLNHTEENKMKRVYQRQELKAEQADAWRVLGDRLNVLILMDGSNVVLMRPNQHKEA